jgi:hypothetical protein
VRVTSGGGPDPSLGAFPDGAISVPDADFAPVSVTGADFGNVSVRRDDCTAVSVTGADFVAASVSGTHCVAVSVTGDDCVTASGTGDDCVPVPDADFVQLRVLIITVSDPNNSAMYSCMRLIRSTKIRYKYPSLNPLNLGFT